MKTTIVIASKKIEIQILDSSAAKSSKVWTSLYLFYFYI